MFKLIKDQYTIGQTLKVNQFLLDKLNKTITSSPSIQLELLFDASLYDQFRVHVFSTYTIQITYGTSRGLDYAFEAIEEISKYFMIGLYEGGPDFKIRGIIEGFYGTPWTHLDRIDVIHFISKYKMNAYFYAPKDDQYHRKLWRVLYPKKELTQLLELVHEAKKVNVDFYFCISPGNDFIYSEQSEFEILYAKIDQLLSSGVKHFSLLMDDINYVLKDESLDRFKRPGIAHAYISNQLNLYLKSKTNDFKLVMCPTEYWQNWDTEYRNDLKEQMDSDIMVFWTGYRVVAEYIPNQDGLNALESFGHPLILWDNYPVNDMATDRIFMGPLINRGKRLYESHIGMISNPMIEWHLSKISVMTMASYMWDSKNYDPEIAYLDALKELTSNSSHLLPDYKNFTDNNRHSLIHYTRMPQIESAVESLDYNVLDSYFDDLMNSINQLENNFDDSRFISQAKPWFERFRKDYALYQLIKSGKATIQDTLYIKDEKHTLGTNFIVKLAKKLDLYDGPVYKKERKNYWDILKNKK